MSATAFRDALERANVKDGSTLSFHHHLRNGDDVMRQVLATCDTAGLRDLHIAPSSLFPCHASLVPFIERGVVTRITTSYMNGPLADAVVRGALPHPVRLQNHGGRARAMASGELRIDAAFIATPAVDAAGNLSGAVGPQACGPLGYAMVDADQAAHVVAVGNHRTKTVPRICIFADKVDQYLWCESLGDATQISSGTTGRAPSAKGRAIADLTAQLIACSGLLVDGFRFQTGAGATSLAVAQALAPMMADQNIMGGFAAGGITLPLVKMHRTGLFRQLWDVQAFDLGAVTSYGEDAGHKAMSADLYANPDRSDSIAQQLDVMILGATEVDMDFNVNVTCASDGRVIGGSGGHADTARGATLPIVTTPLAAGGFAKLVKHLTCLTTPGDTIGAVVTEAGIATHPARPELAERAQRAGLPVKSMSELRHLAEQGLKPKTTPRQKDRIVVECENPDGVVIGWVSQQ